LLSLFAFLPLRQPGDRHQVIALLEVDEAHPLGVPAMVEISAVLSRMIIPFR
jgi:hypothetical protein